MLNKFTNESINSVDGWENFCGAICPFCGKTEVEYNSSMVLTSYPPQYKCRCKSCGEHFYSGMCGSNWTNKDALDNMIAPSICDPLPGQAPYIGDFPNSPYLGGNQGWICPKCGRVMAPHIDYCVFCCSSSGVTINTNKLDGNDKLNIEKLVEDQKQTTLGDPFIYRNKLGDDYYNWLTTTNNEMNETNKMDIRVQQGNTIELNEQMKNYFLEQSESVFEAVDKYKEWKENNNK